MKFLDVFCLCLVLTLAGCGSGQAESPLDSDGDGLSDEAELIFQSDPHDPDTDDDGLTDKEEAEAGTDPRQADTDGDGLSDAEELNDYDCDPTLADTDGDGIPDSGDRFPRDADKVSAYLGNWPDYALKDAMVGSEPDAAPVSGATIPRWNVRDQFDESVDLFDLAGYRRPILIAHVSPTQDCLWDRFINGFSNVNINFCRNTSAAVESKFEDIIAAHRRGDIQVVFDMGVHTFRGDRQAMAEAAALMHDGLHARDQLMIMYSVREETPSPLHRWLGGCSDTGCWLPVYSLLNQDLQLIQPVSALADLDLNLAQ